MQLKPGDLVAGRFRLEAEAGAGGMGTVFRAVDGQTQALVALKALHADEAGDARRFARECELLARLVHPAVVRYVDHGVHEGTAFLVMEWLEGEGLDERLRRRPLAVAQACAVIKRLAEGLEAAHRLGVVHRDLKPSNVVLVRGEVEGAQLIDFGIALQLGEVSRVTSTGHMVGTWSYMSPERVRGQPVDARADVYSLGVLLFEALTGRRMVNAAQETGVLVKILLEEAPRVSKFLRVPEALDELVAQMVAKEAADRPADCRAVIEALTALDLGAGVDAERERVLTGSERRILSVVLARGAIPQDATMPHDGVAARPEAERVRRVAQRYGGALEFLPDGTAMLVVADTGSTAEQVFAATRCALDLAELVDPEPVALATGLATVSRRLPVGELVDRAVGLLVDAPGVLVDRVTAGLLGARFELQPEGEHLRLVGERQANEAHTVPGRGTPFVGRKRELATLGAVLDECVEERLARAVLITGPPGVGKSRVAQEFMLGIEHDVDLWIARGDPARTGSAFGMIADTVRRAAEVPEGTPLEVARQRLRAVVDCVPEAEAERVACFLGELCGAHSLGTPALHAARRDPVLMGQQLRRAWLDLLDGATARRPVVLVLEDLHYGGRVVARLVEQALARLAERPLMVIALAQPELHEALPDLWAEHDLTALRMKGLPRKACEALVQRRLGAVSAEQVAALVARAQGNAFFLEELVRAAQAGEWDALPETVLAIAQAPLARLTLEGRRVLRAASVFGATFWRGGVRTLLGEASARLVDEWLPVLVHEELIGVSLNSRFAGEAQYSFRHGLVREAAYELLTAEDRALGHGLAFRWLEAQGEPDAAVLAAHARQSEAPAAALPWLLRAAEAAFTAHDFQGAVTFVEQALELEPSSAQLGALRAVQAEAVKWLGRDREAIELGELALALLPRGSDRWFRTLQVVSANAANLGEHTRCAQIAAELQADDLGDWGVARVHATLAVASGLFYAGRAEEAEVLLRAGETATGPHSPPDVAARLHFVRGLRALMVQKDAGLVLSEHARAAELFLEAGELQRAHNVRVNVGAMRLALGCAEEAAEELRAVVAVAEAEGLKSAAAFARHNLGLALARTGRLVEARAVLHQTLGPARAQGNVRLEGGSWAYLAEVALAEGDLAAAIEAAERAATVLAKVPTARAYALALRARAALESDPEEALRWSEQAMALVDSVHVEEGDAAARLVWAEALRAVGREGEAAEAFQVARARLMERAARISPQWRTRFLEGVPEHARTLLLSV